MTVERPARYPRVDTEEGIRIADVSVDEVYLQVVERLEIQDALAGTNYGITAARVVRALWDIMRERRRKRLPMYSAQVVQGAVFLLVPWRLYR